MYSHCPRHQARICAVGSIVIRPLVRICVGRMIKAVLDMQGQTVSKIMQPRVDIVALPLGASASTVLRTAVLTKYSRIPIYSTDIDHIVGVVLCKNLLNCMSIHEDNSLQNKLSDSLGRYTSSSVPGKIAETPIGKGFGRSTASNKSNKMPPPKPGATGKYSCLVSCVSDPCVTVKLRGCVVH